MPDPIGLADSALRTLAYTPFIDPLDLHGAWFWLLLPLAVLIAVAYKAVRVPDMTRYMRQTVLFSAQIIFGILGLYVAAIVTLNYILPAIL